MKQLEVMELKEGMVLAEPIIDSNTNKLLINSGEVLTNFKIGILKKREIKDVYVLDEYTINVGLIDIVRIELRKKLNTLILMLAPQEIESSESSKMIEVSLLAQKLVSEITENEEIINFCIEMKLVNSRFLYEHSISTCALSLLIAGAMDLDEKEVKEIGSAALLHDLGLIEMPLLLETIDKQNKNTLLGDVGIPSSLDESKDLTPSGRMWKEHTMYGYYICKEKGIYNENLRKIIFHHHENWNGNGFPNGLEKEDIPLGSRIIRVCDVYDRLIRNDNYLRYQAIEALYAGGGFYFDSNIVNVFTKSLSVYPLGSVVRLSTGEIGVVVNVRKNKGPRPIVRIYYNRVNKPLTYPKEIDLGVNRTTFIKEIL